MWPYIILIFPIFMMSFFNLTKEFNNKTTVKLLFAIYLIFLSLFAGLRKFTVFYYSSYRYIFLNSLNRPLFGSGSIEPGYILLNKSIMYLTGNFHVLLWLLAFVSVFFVMKFIYQFSPYKIFSLYFYISIYFIGGITG